MLERLQEYHESWDCQSMTAQVENDNAGHSQNLSPCGRSTALLELGVSFTTQLCKGHTLSTPRASKKDSSAFTSASGDRRGGSITLLRCTKLCRAA